jgi:serine/arginine repetitive matrix protein 2
LCDCSVRETHQIAEAQQEKNAKLREAFGISEYFVEGSSLDPQRHVKEAQAKAAAEQNKKYTLVRTPSPVPAAAADTDKDRDKENPDKIKKRKRKTRER